MLKLRAIGIRDYVVLEGEQRIGRIRFAGERLPRRPVPALDQNQESGISRLQPRAGSILDGTIASAQRRFSGGALQSPRRQRGPGSARFRSKKCRASCFVGAL